MKIGYARVSSTDQHLDRQIERLQKEGCEKIFEDKFSGATKARPALEKMLAFIREGDIVLITELDRLGRNNADLTDIMDEIQRKKATLDILNLPSFSGIEDENLRRLLNNIIIELYKYQAESERKRIRERQQQGIMVAKAAGHYKGRKRLFTDKNPRLQLAFDLYRHRNENGKTLREISEATGISRRTLDRYLISAGLKSPK